MWEHLCLSSTIQWGIPIYRVWGEVSGEWGVGGCSEDVVVSEFYHPVGINYLCSVVGLDSVWAVVI